MKKILRLFFIIISIITLISTNSIAEELRLDKEIQYQKKIMETGFKILNVNDIENRMTFYYVADSKVRIYSSQYKKRINFYKGIFPFFEDDNEIAALLSREISYINDSSRGLNERCNIGYSPRKYEKKSDRRAVDYLVKAGYNPIALIVVLNKITEEPQWFESYVVRHSGLNRQIYVYEYIYQKYPNYIANNDYLENDYYQNFLRTTAEARQKIRKVREIRVKHRKQNAEEKIRQND